MEFNEKLQELRKQKGLTQEALAEALFVSRTAVSKWESGRGYPNIDSLKGIAKFFGVTVDQLLSGDELLTLAEEDTKVKEGNLRDLVFGLLDLSTIMFLFLPLFGQRMGGEVQSVSLISLTEISLWLRAAYFAIVTATAIFGVLTIALQNCQSGVWVKSKSKISLALNGGGVLMFIISQQPYGGAFLFVFLMIKVLMMLKKH